MARSVGCLLILCSWAPVRGQPGPPPGPGPGQGSLKAVPVPTASLGQYVRDSSALLVLGKSWFWDAQVSSDGRLACASCHFHAGADHRLQNQLAAPTAEFQANYTLTNRDFPFHYLSDITNNRSDVVRDSAQVTGSAGVFRRMFVDVAGDTPQEDGFDIADTPAFSVAGANVRQVTGRNSPSVINAVFYVRNFWDGRASNIFTGATPFGDSDARLNAVVAKDGRISNEPVRIENASLASQAVGPLLNSVEMSYEGRSWSKAASKILALRPLASQAVAPGDSVLGRLANPGGTGLASGISYLTLVQAAFQPDYWNSGQAESNFPLFWGLAIQAYEATLISDESPFDRFSEGNLGALSPEQRRGLDLFRTRAGCSGCHAGPEFSAAAFSTVNRQGAVGRRRNGVTTDTGFFRIGVRPPGEDPGLGAQDGFGKPLAIAVAQNPASQQAVNGTFKTPTLRNVEFTGPYFHNGGQATLEQVIDFYNRGGDFPDGNVGPGIRRLNLAAEERAALVAFLKSLSDDRVRFERAPFDHPALCIPIGHAEQRLDPRFPLSAADKWALLPAVGGNGNTVPLQTFEELLEARGADGSRAHHLNTGCPD